MEEIEKRFELIRLAVELSDYEVIDRQINHLRNVSTESHLHAILDDLESRNFRQALYEMKNYSVDIQDDFFEPKTTTAETEPAAHTNLFDLAEDTRSMDNHIVSVDDMMEMTRESATSGRDYGDDNHITTGSVPFEAEQSASETETDPLFSLDQEMPTADQSVYEVPETTQAYPEEAVDDAGETQESEELTDAPLFTDDLLHNEEVFSLSEEKYPEHAEDEVQEKAEEASPVPESDREIVENEIFAFDTFEESAQIKEDKAGGEGNRSEDIQPQTEEDAPPTRRAWDFEPDEEEGEYPRFAYMDQKFRNMLHQHPRRTEEDEEVCAEAKDFIDFVTTHNYTESQVEAAISRYQELKEQGKNSEAAQMLIAAATTESTFAQFMLARELFKGDLLEQNYPEAFTRINQLAEEDYPEAICDLGQLYEYGIGIDKNKRHALLLYEEAAEMGIERAQRHYDRLSSTNPLKSFASMTSSLLGRKRG